MVPKCEAEKCVDSLFWCLCTVASVGNGAAVPWHNLYVSDEWVA